MLKGVVRICCEIQILTVTLVLCSQRHWQGKLTVLMDVTLYQRSQDYSVLTGRMMLEGMWKYLFEGYAVGITFWFFCKKDIIVDFVMSHIVPNICIY